MFPAAVAAAGTRSYSAAQSSNGWYQMSRDWRPFAPSRIDRQDLAVLASIADESGDIEPSETIRKLRARATYKSRESGDVEARVTAARLAVAASLLADLVEQGWALHASFGSLAVAPPSAGPETGESFAQAKDRHRQALHWASDRQIASDGVQDFLTSMERPRSFAGRTVSIVDLIDDGESLVEQLHQLAPLGQENRAAALARLIEPVVQVCDSEGRCDKTGLKLQDIWRYFRHTWSLEYNSLPGRTLRILVRNAARPNSPVMGIAMLASPAANLLVRDRWIGWTTDELAIGIISGRWDAPSVAKRLASAVRQAIDEIRSDDLVAPEELNFPSKSTLFKLRMCAASAESRRISDLKSRDGGEDIGLVDIRCLDKEALVETDWRRLSATSLYTRKRAEQLIPLLETWLYFREAGWRANPSAALMEALVTKQGRTAISVALNEIKKRHLAADVADVSVCGAVAPYNQLLSGKLVALLMASREVRECYRARYRDQVSEIASQIAGRSVRRASDLKVITTTSLYGIGSSQYNRLKLKASNSAGLKSDVIWEELDPTEGFTVTHVSRQTVEYMRLLGRLVYGTRRVNSVFGEGSSPRTRQIREGLNLIGINNDDVLKHSLVRRVYACDLYPGARNDLLGFGRSTRRGGESVRAIAKGWMARWVVNRVLLPHVLESVSATGRSSIPQELRQRASRAVLLDEEKEEGVELRLAI